MNDDIKFNGLTADEWEELANPQAPNQEQLGNLGIVQQEQPEAPQGRAERDDYEDLGYWQTVGDELTAGAVELSKFFVPKKYELNYTPRTRAGEAFQTFSKYLYGIGGLFMGGEIAAGVKGLAMANELNTAAKVAGGAEKILKGDKFFKTTKGGMTALGVKGLNIGTQGVLQGAIIDATIHDTDEGRIADIFGDTNNKFIEWLQTDDNDSTAMAKFKNVVDGALFSIGINGVFSAAEPLMGKMFKNIKTLKTANPTEAEAKTITEEIVQDNVKLGKIAETSDLVDTVRNIKEQAKEAGDDASEILINTLHPDNIEAGQQILKMLDDGENIFIHDDGTFAIKIERWDEAYKVTQEEYEKQLKAQDMINAEAGVEVRAGDTALQHQDEAVRHTWINRGWIGENETLNSTNANKIAKNYKDKFEIDNNIKVEFVDGLTIKGQAVEGNTSATKFLGKKAKNTQNSIDKKALQVQKLKDKVTMLKGGNAEVMDDLTVAKEELRIAQNELKELKKAAKNLNNKPNITIKIDKNAKNPYATLRAELEHARDIAKGEVPKEEGKHFARYNGANEGEMAGGYTYKKSVGKNKALNGEVEVKPTEPKVEEPVKNVEPSAPKAEPAPVVEKVEPQQLKLDFSQAKTTEEVVENVTSGKAVLTSADDVQAVVSKTVELDPEISGTTWEAIAKDSDKLADFMVKADDLGYTAELTEALSLNDVSLMDKITRKVLAAQKLNAHLGDRLAALGDNPTYEQKQAVIDLIDQIGRYTKETGSASGRSLEARKLINKGIETFGSLRLPQLTKEGISQLSDLLATTIENIDLNFTRGKLLSPMERKQALMEQILQNTDSPFVRLLAEDEKIANKFNSILDELFSKGGKITPETINDKLSKAIVEARYDEVFEATKLTDNPETKARVIRKWCDKQGGLTSYYVHNLLSGVGTLAKNVISGGMNTVYFPAKKIIAGYLGGGEALSREGWNTYKNMLSCWQESWSLCKEAFLQGDGKLSMMRDTMNLAEDEVFNGFREWNFDDTSAQGVWHSIQNFHSVMTRAMGASDEFMSQLNYRSIMRAKSIEQAEKLAGMYKITDEATKSNIADRLFQNAFDNAGKPTNVEALAEAKDILYQLPLNGQIFDRTSGEMVQVRNQSWVSGLAQNLNTAAAANPLLKIMFPFVKTGANILQQNLEHNGLYAVLSNNQRQLLMSNTREGALARSQVAFGMFSFMTAAGLAMNGRITGSAPADQKERKALFETGWKPYSIRIGGKYVSYQGYEPIQTILGFAADSVNIYGNITNSDDEAKWGKFSQQVLSTAVNNFLDKAAFRTGLKQLAFITSPDENAEEFKKAFAQTAQGFLPDAAFVRNTSSLGKREMTSPSNPYERIFNNYFNRGLGDYRRDIFGNRQDNYGLLVTNVADDYGNMPEYAELERLSQYGFNPSEISKTIHDTTLKYQDFKDPTTGRSAYDSMQEELSQIELDGKTLQEAVRELVGSEEYQDLPDGVNMNGFKYSSSEATKLNAIREVFVEYNNAALNNVIKEQGDDFVDSKGRTMSEAKEEVEIEKMNVQINQGLDHNLSNQLRRF